ncbi:YcbK family protein [Jiella avicenniae]|uniref:D-Ala-D-Ala carboxypeptidase family metallohydrolase n=1 Tax=Jiella avicenniae TaxID=2907202 RepID=A0A9X1P1L4_9HYPH|nr:D-Ala-D-Ala carboxypeptidase family metallohydrolase [Jiella avicenniae]MCE7028426.1 D-Ala-D-Ala carboxypeptidase family metallohydrolase [Jiella avicenniae]
MTARSPVATGRLVGSAIFAGALLAALPFLSSCVSAVDDTSAFGFAGATASKATSPGDGAAGGESAAEAVAEAADAEGPEVASVDPQRPTAPRSSDDGSSAEAMQAAEAATLRDRMTTARPVAAYAGGTVSEGDAIAGDRGERPAQQSLFASLFAQEKARTPIANAEKSKGRRIVLKRDEPADAPGGIENLPGVDPSSLFEIGQKASANEADAIDDVMSTSYRVASLGGFARLSPNGLRVARDDVQTSCFPADLVAQIRALERRFGSKAVITSGYRSPDHNRRVNGARRSQHMGCKAADLFIPGADHLAVAAYARSLPGRGGVGTYCHTDAIHVDVGPKRDWNWRCRRR